MLCTFGDLLLDVVVQLDGPIEPNTDAYGRTTVHAGGQAANVAAWSAALGRPARLICKRSTDVAGRLVAEELASRDVEISGPTVPSGTGTVVSVTSKALGRSMLSDRGVSATLGTSELQSGWLAGCSDLFVTGYSLTGQPMRDAALEAGRLARGAGARVSLDVASTTAVRAGGVSAFHAAASTLEPHVVFATEQERDELGPVQAPVQVVKRGAAGVVVIEGGDAVEHAAVETEVVDTTGAGDALAAGFLAGGIELGLEAAARCVARAGAMP